MNYAKIHPKPEKIKKEAVNNPLLMSLPKAAQKLEVSTRTVRRLSQRGILPQIVKVGNCARISWQGVQDYYNSLYPPAKEC